ncbi:DUF551 domain-containing protein [Salmonella enterica]|uniref:DUF551 domain-containing protein n=1 Tax=Salmonella enterica TaxID=28901 RepID=UPI001D037A75|nr:DUF551 domain-containing protein [Salmonella enterica]
MATITNKKQYPSEQYLNELITNMEFAARAPVEVVRAMAAELQKRRKADSAEPVAWRYRTTDINGNPNPRWSFSEEPSLLGLYQPLYADPQQPLSFPDAMSQPVSNRDELPYAQVKAAADLYALCWQSGEVVTYTPDPEKATIWLNNYSGTCVQEYVKLERLQEALSGNSPVIPGGWISCSERMPEDEQEVIVHNKLGYRYVSYFDEHSGLFFDMRGDNQMNCIEHILVTHWMPLPEPPQEVK